MVHCVHGGDVGEEGLGGADVGGGLVPPDVLLPGLQGQAETLVIIHIFRHTNHTPGHVSHILCLGCEESLNAE